MPIVTIEMWSGRTVEQKRKIVKAFTEAMTEILGVPRESINIVIRDVPKTNWGVSGKLASEL